MAPRTPALAHVANLAFANAGKVAAHIETGNHASNIVGVGVAGRQGYREAKRQGKSDARAVAEGVALAAPQVALAAAPFVAPHLKAKELSYQRQAVAAAQRYAQSVRPATRAKYLAASSRAALAGNAFKIATGIAKRANPIQAVIGAVIGAMHDDNRIRGAIRGALSSFDPTEVLAGVKVGGYGYDKGLATTVVDSILGEANHEKRDERAELRAQTRTALAAMKPVSKQEPVATVVRTKLRGWANPKVQQAAQAARKRRTMSV
jgi:hypothetical protein